MLVSPISRCRICGNTDLQDVLQLGDQKLTGVFPKSTSDPIVSGPLDLVRCTPLGDATCGLLQLRHSYPLDAMYGDNYGYRSGLNASMVRHLQEKVKGLIALARPASGALVADIGCNDGTLLKAYPDSFRRVGLDPVAKKFLGHYPQDIEVVTDFFSLENWKARLGGEKAVIITSVAMFYDLEAPLEFVKAVAECLAPDGIWHFEQSYMPLMVSQLAYDTICHEHIEYYALRQIDWMLRRAGLKIVALEKSLVNGGSLAVTAAKTGCRLPAADVEIQRLLEEEQGAGFETMQPFTKFRERVFRHRDDLKSAIAEILDRGQVIAGYGASTKGNVLLQFCGLSTREIPFIGEVNPEKFGSLTPGTNIPIVSESEMHRARPDALLVLPWHFRENIISRESEFIARGGRLLFPLPAIGLYPH